MAVGFWRTIVGTFVIAECVGASAASAQAHDVGANFRRAVDSLVSLPAFHNALWGVLVVDPERGDTLYSRNAGTLFMSASNMKLITSAVALSLLGADYRYTTTLAARGPRDHARLNGDLLVFGRGDPTMSDHARGDAMAPLREMADSLVANGIQHIAGRVLLGANVFPGPTLGFGWSWDDLDGSDGAPVDELLFNEGFGVVHVRGGSRPGDAVIATTSPAKTYPALRVLAHTVARGDSEALKRDPLRAVKDTAHGDIVVRGAIVARDSAALQITFSNPDQAFLAALREALVERGIVVDGVPLDSTPSVDSLVRLSSVTLREILPVMMKSSQNQMAEMLFLTVALAQTGVGLADSARHVEERQLAAWGVPSDEAIIRDGSGLSRYDYLSPETIVRVLDAMRRSPAFDDYFAALPIAGVDGTLRARMRGTPAQGNVHAKTGSIANARSLSGYVTTADGHTLLFSLLCNNWTVPRAVVDAVQDSIAIQLASLRLH